MVSTDSASCTYHVASQHAYENIACAMAAICILLGSFCFFKDFDATSDITNLRPTYGTIPIRLEMNTFCFKKIDDLPAKFLG